MSRRRRNASAPRRQAPSRQPATQQRDYGFQDWINLYQSNWQNLAGQWPGFQMTYGKDPAEPIGPNFADFVVGGMQSNGVVFALEQKRIQIFSQVRYQFQGLNNGRPGKLFPKPNLSLLERPWRGGTTSDLNARMLVDADLAGNSFWVAPDGDEMVRLRPDWVEIVLKARMLPLGPDGETVQVGFKQIGILYYEGGMYAGAKPAVFLPGEYTHFAPIPDPLATYRGMSWLTPVIREIQADTQATKHKLKFFENAAPQPLDAGILTPSGWSTMGQIRVGGRVIGLDGKPKTVLGVYPQGEQDIYRVTFSCGGSTECTADHLWTVANAYDRKRGVTRTLPLSRLVADGITYDSGPAKWSVPLVDPVEFDEPGELPIDPYLLGSLLGDGSFRSNGKGSGGVSMAAHRDDVDEQQATLAALLPEGVSITRRDRGGWSEFYFKGRGGPRPNPLTVRVRELGLFDKLGYEKSIPDLYLRASVNQRIALLQGLIDTDGNIDRGQPNTVRFDSTSERLARQVGELAGGLGAIASVRQSRLATAGHRAQWRVAITRLPEWIVPCRLARKADIYRPEFRGGRWRYIQSVELVGRKPAQCIKVDTEDHLYVTDDFILTHNTPNLAVSLPKEITPAQFEAFVEKMDARHKGADHAYETLYTGGGADVTVVGANMHQLDFKVTQGAGETRLAAAAGIHPVIVGLSEGMQGSSLNSGNYNAAKRSTVDTTFRHLWQNAAGSLEQLVTPPDDISRLWYDARDVPFLHEDQKDAADIQQLKATTITMYVREGFTPESAIAAVDADDRTLLVHTGLVSVQLQPPGTVAPQSSANGQAARSRSMRRRVIAELARKYNPAQFRDPHSGKWSSGGVSRLVSELLAAVGNAGDFSFVPHRNPDAYMDWRDFKNGVFDYEITGDDGDTIGVKLGLGDLAGLHSALGQALGGKDPGLFHVGTDDSFVSFDWSENFEDNDQLIRNLGITATNDAGEIVGTQIEMTERDMRDWYTAVTMSLLKHVGEDAARAAQLLTGLYHVQFRPPGPTDTSWST